jgi:hypothetical protein
MFRKEPSQIFIPRFLQNPQIAAIAQIDLKSLQPFPRDTGEIGAGQQS